LLTLAISNGTLAPFALAKDLRIAGTTKRSSSRPITTQAGDTVTFYGPRRFDRLAGSPVTVTESFVAPLGVLAPYTMQVQNGASDGTHRVSSASIHLNGTALFTQNEIKDSTPSISQVVNLQAVNTLQVKLTSAVGSFLTISITGVRQVVLPAGLQSIDPIRATQGQTQSVILHGENTHWLAGQTRASFGQEVSVGGASPGELGPVTVTNLTTAVAQVSVSGTAALSPRTVRVVTPNVPAPFPLNLVEESVTLVDGYTVVATSPPSPSSTNVTTIAGLAGSPGFADGIASQARFNNLAGVAVGPDDSIFVADAGNNRIRVVRRELDQSGVLQWVVSTVAGNGTSGFADGPANAAQFKSPQGIAVDSGGVVFVADSSNNRIRRIAVDGTVTTIAGDGLAGLQDGPGSQARFNAPRGLAIDYLGNIYVADTGNAAVRMINPSGQVSTLAGDGTIGSNDSPGARFDCPSGVAVNGSTVYVYLTDKGNHRIRRLDSTGTVITIAGSARGFADGSASAARFAEPSGIAFDGSGKILITDAVNSLIRQVDPVLAANGSSLAVSTLAGSGERGQTDGPGSQATFLSPRGIAVTASSAVVVADSGNHVLRRLTLPPFISSISPPSARPTENVSINGERFDARGPERNIVRFTRSLEAGGGQTPATVALATRSALIAAVPEDAATGPVTVQTEGGTVVSSTSFVVLPRFPILTDFSPQSGPVGATITLNGQWLKTNNGDPSVTFAGRGETRLPALVTFASLTQVHVTVPNGAISGPIQLTNAWGQVATAQPFTVEASQDFQLAVSPSTAAAVQHTSATFVVQLTSIHATFTQLARLTVAGLPANVSASLSPSQITAGASSTLTLNLANAELAPGSYPFTLSAAADIDGREIVRTIQATLSVVTAGQTTLSGRVLSTDNQPIIGATISLDGHTAMTDAAGAFLLVGVTAGVDRPVMIDGRTASAPNRTYPVLAEPATIIAGQANAVPYVFYLPPIDIQTEVIIVPGQTTVIGTPRVPGLQLTVPAGANLRNRDNTPVTRVSITPVPIDRTPTPLPPNVTTAMVYTNQPGGAISDTPMPMVYPNLTGADPGTRADLYAFNHDTVQWYVYGYGRVSADGRLIEPEINPATGSPYGLTDFSWYFPSLAPDGNPGDPCNCPTNRTGDPVDLSTGIKIDTMTDVSFGGARGALSLTRIFSSDMFGAPSGPSPIVGRFGRGGKDSYDIKLTGTFGLGAAGRVVFPEERNGRLFSYTRIDPDGALVFTSTGTISHLGRIVRQLTNGTFEVKSAQGEVLRFDSSRRLTAMVDRNGNTTTLSYTGSNLTAVTDPVGRSITFAYNAQNVVERVTDPLGRRWLYTYGTTGSDPQLETVTDPLDIVVRYTYSGRLTSITDGRGIVVKELAYDSLGRVSQQTFAGGGFERYSYELSGTIVTQASVTDSLGRVESKRFNAAGYVLGTTDALHQSTQIERDISTNLRLGTTGPCGCAESTDAFDQRGNMTASTDRLGHTAHWEYEPVFNNVTRATDRLGRDTIFNYDSRGNLTSVKNALNQTTSFAYDAFGQLTSVTDPLNHTSVLEYDTAGNVIAIVDALNHRTTFEYDGIGRLMAANDPLGRRHSMTYDALNQVLSTTDSNNATTLYTYDAGGNLTSLTDALQNHWVWIRDARGRVTDKTDPLNRAVHLTYNNRDELIEVKSPLNRITGYSYDANGRLATITDPLNNIVRLSYDSRGNLTTLVDQRGHTTTYTYDELARPIGRRNPLGQFTDQSYDAVGNVTAFTDQQGRRTNIIYDELHRPSNIAYADASVTYTYDAAGRKIQIADTQRGNASWNYDEANRLLSETTAAGIVTYAYNAANQRTSMTAADASPVSYAYDAAGRLQTVTQGSETFTYAYDTLSRIAGLQRPNGISTAFSYDTVSRLKRLTHSNGLNQTIEGYRYTYTLDDQISSITSLASPQLLPAAKNASGADAANRITQFGPASYSFNSLGQTATKSDVQGTTTYQWDARGRLTGAALPSGQTVSYGYDALGRRASRTAGGVTTNFLYDGLDVVRDSSNGNSTADYLNGPGIDNKLRQTSAGTGALYFLQDHLGSTRALTNASGGVVEQLQYEAFGESAGSSLTRYGFTGRERDALTGLLYYRARWYDPQQSRFITEDPAGVAGGLNAYLYVGNDPLSRLDPQGLSFETFMRGFFSGFVVSGAVAFVIAGIIAGTGGTAGAIMAAIALGIGGYQLYRAIEELATANLCPDEYDEKLGELIGSILGGLVGGGLGARVGGSPSVRGFLADETGSVGRVPGDYLAAKAPKQVQPGIRELEGQYVNDQGRVEPWTAHYDEYGRQIGRTDSNAGNQAAGIPDVHHSKVEYNARYPLGRTLYKHGSGPFDPGSCK
jgi:RHS repeat-associated protein